METEQETAKQKIEKFGRLSVACLEWGAKQRQRPGINTAESSDCGLTSFLGCQRLAIQLYLVSEGAIPGVVLCGAHEGFGEILADSGTLERPARSQTAAPKAAASKEPPGPKPDEIWLLVRPGLSVEQVSAAEAIRGPFARGCDCARSKSLEGYVQWVCACGSFEVILWNPCNASAVSTERNAAAGAAGLDEKTEADSAEALPTYFKILSSFRNALGPLGLDAHIRVG